MTKRKQFQIFCFLFAQILLLTQTVHAYIDPSVMTYAIQALAGIAISIGMFAGVYWRKIKQLFGLDTSPRSADVLNEEYWFQDPVSGERRTSLDFLSKEERERLREKFGEKVRYEKKQEAVTTSVLLGVTISYLWMVYAEVQLQFTNLSEFKYDIFTVFPTLLLMFAVGLITALTVYFLLYKCSLTLFTAGVVFSLVVLIGSYIQGNFLVGGLQVLDGSVIDWSGHATDHIISFVLWAVLFAAAVFLLRKLGSKGFMKLSQMICALLLMALIITNISTGVINKGFVRKRSAAVTTIHEYTMSVNENLVIFVIDAADGATLRRLMETENPEYREILEDFTYFPNTVSAYPYTEQAIPQILTGKWYEFQEPFERYVTKAMEESQLFEQLHQRNYRVGIYEEDLVFDSEKVYEFENIINSRYQLANFAEYARSSFCLMWYMYAPYALKPVFTDPGLYSTLRGLARAEKEAFYGGNDTTYIRMKEATIDTVKEPCFRFIHIDGAHVPFQWDKDVNKIPFEEGSYDQNYQASMTIVREYLQKLKEADVYDQTAIIIMADHGYDLESRGDIGRENPLFMVKGRNEGHEFRVSEQPVSYDDLMGIYVKLLDGEAAENLLPYNDYEQRDRRIIIYDFAHDKDFYEYYQTGYASDESTMIPTGRVFNAEHPGND